MAKTKARFSRDEIGSWTYVRPGTSAAMEVGLGDEVLCVNCGKPISHVFMTDVGPLGGDCLATITGDDSTRKSVVALYKDLPKYNAVFFGHSSGISRTPIVGLNNQNSVCVRSTYLNSGRLARVIACYKTRDVNLVASVIASMFEEMSADSGWSHPGVAVEE